MGRSATEKKSGFYVRSSGVRHLYSPEWCASLSQSKAEPCMPNFIKIGQSRSRLQHTDKQGGDPYMPALCAYTTKNANP